MNFKVFNTLICSVWMFNMVGQQFTDQTQKLGIAHIYGNGQAGGGTSFVDFDGDGFDDITLGSSQNRPIHFYKNIDGSSFQRINLLPDMIDEVKSILWVDYDNDGDKDLFFTTSKSKNRLYENRGNLNLLEITDAAGFPSDSLTSFGACWGDYDRDGLLDVYYGERRIQFIGLPNQSFLYKNQGNNKFKDVTDITNTRDDDGKTQFCSSFIDYNNDKWPDIYTAQDRRRGNTLLQNNKKGSFLDVSTATNADIAIDAMSVSYGDVNADGFLDIYISNTSEGNALLINKEGKRFENEAEKYGVTFNGIAWGTNFVDGDNDGDQDLYVSSMLVGKGNITSTYYTNDLLLKKFTAGPQVSSDTVSSFSNAIGDFNNDGYPDIITSNSEFNSQILINKGGNNNYIKIKLVGMKSNKDGIGAQVIIETPDSKSQKFYTSCGIGFLGQNSDKILVGINDNTVAKVTIIWPTGHKDIITNPQVNRLNIFTEGQSTNGIISIDSDIKLMTPTNDYSELNILAYPNPNSGKFIIDNWDKVMLCQITNLDGKIIQSLTHQNSNGEVSIALSGSYFLSYTDKYNNKTIQKLIISK